MHRHSASNLLLHRSEDFAQGELKEALAKNRKAHEAGQGESLRLQGKAGNRRRSGKGQQGQEKEAQICRGKGSQEIREILLSGEKQESQSRGEGFQEIS